MNTNMLPTDAAAIVATIDPDAYAPGIYYSDFVDMGDWHALLAVIEVGTLGTNGTVDAALLQSTSSAGAGEKAVTSKSITQFTQAGSDADKQAMINLRPEELDIANSFRYVRLRITTDETASPSAAVNDFGATLWGFWPRNGVASDQDLASVDEIVV